MTWNNVQPPCNTCVHCAQSSQYHGNHLGWTLPHAAYLHPQVAILGQLLRMLPTDVAIGRTADVNEKAGVSLLVSETDVRSVGFDLPCSGDGRIPHHYDVIRLHKPIRLMPIPPALHTVCRERPFMNGRRVSLPSTGRPPTRQEGPSRVHVSV